MRVRIATKLVIIFLITSLVPLLIAGLMGYSSSRNMIDVAADANQQIAYLAMSDSMDALSREQEIHLKSVVQGVAGDISEILARIEADTGQLADFAGYLYNNPDTVNRYPFPSVYKPNSKSKMFGSIEENDNSWMGVFGDGVDENGNVVSPEIMEEIYLTEFMDIKFRSIADHNPYAVQLYLNANSQMSRGMPFIEGQYVWVDATEQFAGIPDVTVFDFYFLADKEHDPRRVPVWTELYWDPAGLGWMVSNVAPAYRGQEELMGVVGIDITLKKMIDQIIDVQVEETGFAFMMSQNGQAISFPERAADFLGFKDSFEGDFGDNEQFSLNLTEVNDSNFQAIIQQMMGGEHDLTTYTHPETNQEYFFAYHEISQTGWSVGLVVPIEEVIAPALATNAKITNNTQTTLELIVDRSQGLMTTFALILGAIVLVIIPVALAFSRTLSKPIKALNNGSKRIGQGDLSHRISVYSGDEIEDLAHTFNQMAGDLQAKVEEIEAANKELRQLDELKSQFISMASHELRTPLISIQGYVDLLRKDKEQSAEERQKMLDTVARNTNRLTRIVTELLDISRIEENKLVLRKDTISIAQVISEVADEQKPSLDKRRHTLTLKVQGNIPPVLGDRDRIAQVIINLLGNAIKYTPDGGQITICAATEESHVHISIIDNGIGIKEEDVSKLFKRFSTVGDVTKHKSGKDEFMAGGTGLGLSIIKGIIEAHEGQVWAESEYKKGSIFHVLLPLTTGMEVKFARVGRVKAADSAVYRATHFEQQDNPATITNTGAKLKILVIDDEEDILAVTQQVLDDTYRVLTAKTSATGLKAAMTKNPDLILLDIWMPGISGYDVCKTLKQNPKTKETPVIIFTAATEKVNEDKAREVGADGFVTKPFKKDNLVNLIEGFRKNPK